MRAAALVADPAGDADVEPEIQIGMQLLGFAGEAMRHRCFHAVRAQHLREARVRVARVQEERLAKREPQRELRHEALLLRRMRRIVAVEVEAAFADRHAARVQRELAQLGDRLLIAVARMMRVYACRAIQIVTIRDLGGEPALEHRRARDDDGANGRGTCPRQHRVEIVMEARVREVGADIGQMHACQYKFCRINYVPVPDYVVSSASCAERSMPPAVRLAANAEPSASIGAASHSRKQRRPPGSQTKSTRAAQLTAKSCASFSAVSRTRPASAASCTGSRRGRRRYL